MVERDYGTIKSMGNMTRDFVSDESRKFRFKLGKYLASSLSGFVVGVIVASMAWLIGIWYFKQAQAISSYSTSMNQHMIVAPISVYKASQ